jgi:hypothetical protein
MVKPPLNGVKDLIEFGYVKSVRLSLPMGVRHESDDPRCGCGRNSVGILRPQPLVQRRQRLQDVLFRIAAIPGLPSFTAQLDARPGLNPKPTLARDDLRLVLATLLIEGE